MGQFAQMKSQYILGEYHPGSSHLWLGASDSATGTKPSIYHFKCGGIAIHLPLAIARSVVFFLASCTTCVAAPKSAETMRQEPWGRIIKDVMQARARQLKQDLFACVLPKPNDTTKSPDRHQTQNMYFRISQLRQTRKYKLMQISRPRSLRWACLRGIETNWTRQVSSVSLSWNYQAMPLTIDYFQLQNLLCRGDATF